jgi:hypothetical protein
LPAEPGVEEAAFWKALAIPDCIKLSHRPSWRASSASPASAVA